MTKNLLFIFATVGLILNVGGCTSKKSQDDNQVVENADVDKIESEELASPPQDPTVTEDSSLQAALGETTDSTVASTNTSTTTTTDATTETVTAAPADVAAAPTLDENNLNAEAPPAVAESVSPPKDTFDSTSTTTTESVATSTEPTTPITDTSVNPETPVVESSSSSTNTTTYESSSSSSSSMASSAKSSSSSSLRKIALTSPYQSKAGWVNTVYVARPGEKLKEVSQKILGSDKSKELKKIAENSYLKSHSLKAGDKVYYVSPNRPDDSSKTLFYYEDMGMVPETYVAKKGDNLKKVAKELLGYDRAWVELWTANPIESKTKLAEGDTIKYWRSASSIAPATNVAQTNGAAKLIDSTQASGGIAANMPPPPSEPAQVASTNAPPPDMNALPPPPAGNELPPPPTEANALPPPPPPPDVAPPPPPPPIDAAAPEAPGVKKNVHAEEEVASTSILQDNDTMMSLGAVGVLVAALAFVLIRRKKKKAAEQAASYDSNVGT